MAYELKFEIVDLCWIRRSTHKCSSSEGHGRRSHRRDCETGLLRFLAVFIGPDEGVAQDFCADDWRSIEGTNSSLLFR